MSKMSRFKSKINNVAAGAESSVLPQQPPTSTPMTAFHTVPALHSVPMPDVMMEPEVPPEIVPSEPSEPPKAPMKPRLVSNSDLSAPEPKQMAGSASLAKERLKAALAADRRADKPEITVDEEILNDPFFDDAMGAELLEEDSNDVQVEAEEICPVATQILFEAHPASEKPPKSLKRSLITEELISEIMGDCDITSINRSFLGELAKEVNFENHGVVLLGAHEFITKPKPHDFSLILEFVADMDESIKNNSFYVADLTQEIDIDGVTAYSLTISMEDLQAISLSHPEYSFGVAEGSGRISDLRLVVECQK